MASLLKRPGGQDHDRIGGDDFVVPAVISRDDGGGDITAWQKMLSAMSGSLLTSLLGAHPFSNRVTSRANSAKQSHP